MQLHSLCGLVGLGALLPWCGSSTKPMDHQRQAAPAGDSESSKEPLGHEWQTAQAGDSRSPCPMLNSLANHGFLPRDGHDITYQNATSALQDALNFDPAPFVGQIHGVMKVSSTGSNGTFNLVDLNQKPFEHDASLSRAEASSGDALHFDPKVWAQTAGHFGDTGVVSIEAAAEARADRIATARRTDPDFNLTESQTTTTYAESGLYLIVFGDKTNGNARTDWVKSMFEQERLPYNQGWSRPQELISAADVGAMTQKIEAVPVEG
ncbi:sterigmatocystin biosynthesis peroxidase stcC [Apiospora phragmitis]|uniref:Sterigmatocystin biosynthesis peroxidase stcC n=1 Tax=Apiospora phragmitis TaxID=2905665 RepID=A0ABR1T930_9PEZI